MHSNHQTHGTIVSLLLASCLAACGAVTLPDQEQADAAPGVDAGADTAAPALCESWTHALYFDPCALPDPAGVLVLSAPAGPYTFNTDSGVLTAADGSTASISTAVLDAPGPVRAISASSVIIESGAVLRIQGTLPALIASWSSMDMEGSIDVSSGVAGVGAGANPPACADGGAQPGQPTGGRGDGGGGGAFAAPGGHGGAATGPGGAGGLPALLPERLRGGCPGGDGADGDNYPQNRGIGGAGGGAVHLSALEQLFINGPIHAGGAGGGGGDINHGGGGGGGSGGLIGVAAPAVVIGARGIVAANGGGGGGGGGGANPANRGQDGTLQAVPAAGGSGPSGNGGNGGALDNGAGGNGISGGGGGGGSTGYIVISADSLIVDSAAVLSPAHIER